MQLASSGLFLKKSWVKAQCSPLNVSCYLCLDLLEDVWGSLWYRLDFFRTLQVLTVLIQDLPPTATSRSDPVFPFSQALVGRLKSNVLQLHFNKIGLTTPASWQLLKTSASLEGFIFVRKSRPELVRLNYKRLKTARYFDFKVTASSFRAK